MVTEKVRELVESLSLDATGLVYAELALVVAGRLDAAPEGITAIPSLSKELRALVAMLTAGRGETDKLLRYIFTGEGEEP